MFKVPEKYRVKTGPLASDDSYGNNGQFILPGLIEGQLMSCIASDGGYWDHVSVAIIMQKGYRTPAWEDMCAVKEMFWDDEDWVVQFHPDEREYVNCHPHVLHLWRSQDQKQPTPPSWMVGPKTK